MPISRTLQTHCYNGHLVELSPHNLQFQGEENVTLIDSAETHAHTVISLALLKVYANAKCFFFLFIFSFFYVLGFKSSRIGQSPCAIHSAILDF